MNSATFQVQYRDCDAGWIHIDISVGAKTTRVCASEVFDPFRDLIAWLESIVTGATISEFEIDEEGSRVTFRYSQGDKQGLFTLTDSLDGQVLIQTSISPGMLVAEFYTKLRAFAMSPAYRKEEWEIETLWERLAAQIAGVSEDELIDQLLVYPARAIQQIFWKVAPSYEMVYPTSISPKERIGRFYDYVTEDSHPIDGAIEVPDLYPFPPNFDDMPYDERRSFLHECLTDSVSSFDGVKLAELRSVAIDEWLTKQEVS